MKTESIGFRGTLFFLIAVALFMISGCSGQSFTGSSTAVAPGDSALPPVSSFADDIQDIVLPTEMEWNRKKSMTIKTESFRGGVWRYEGRVEPISLKDFMISAMQDHKWKLVGEATSQDIMLAFVKPSKTCMMVISAGAFGKTELTLYVTIDKTAAAGLNPFGEAVSK
ncbi:MAG TPA: hypothetical protein ENK27_02255 [Desulfobulbus sp.]|nr:hypothetical protein [Desulfobulbus sp.]